MEDQQEGETILAQAGLEIGSLRPALAQLFWLAHPIHRPIAGPGEPSLVRDFASSPQTRQLADLLDESTLYQAGDAGSGESNIRKWIIENDWLAGIIALPDQLFFNTGISTYIWIVTNKKSRPQQRQGSAHQCGQLLQAHKEVAGFQA